MSQARDRQITLEDGRRLGFTEYGTASGSPVFYFHGLPGSRLEAKLTDQTAKELNIRIIAPDRPGIGLSDAQEKRTLEDWPADVLALADRLEVDRFAVLGVSGGGPYAAACAWAIAERLKAAGIVCGLGPVNGANDYAGMNALARGNFYLARHYPGLLQATYQGPVGWLMRRFPGLCFNILCFGAREADREVLGQIETRQILLGSFSEALSRGTRGTTADLLLLSRPWGFSPEQIRFRIILWHGEMDVTVPFAMGQRMAEQIPDCTARFFPDEGHFSMPVKHMTEILSCLIEKA